MNLRGRIRTCRALTFFEAYILSFSSCVFYKAYTFCHLSTSVMASRRISAACIAQTGRCGLLPLLPRHPSLRITEVSRATRYLSTTPIRYKQEANIKLKRDPAPLVIRGASKLFKDADSAVADLKSGSTILSSGFGLCGTAGRLLLHEKSEHVLT
jgi:hypothetical protein